jgi:hypothetical protein
MRTSLSIKNYRCFVQPTVVDFRKGFTAFVGINNAGKSALMRFLLEFRDWFRLLANPGEVNASLTGVRPLPKLLHVFDAEEVFSNRNSQPIEIQVILTAEPSDGVAFKEVRLLFVIERGLRWQTTLYLDGDEVGKGHAGIMGAPEFMLMYRGNPHSSIHSFFELCNSLTNTLYIGPFRNTINIGTNDNYLDIQIGTSFIERFRGMKTGPVKRENVGISQLTEQIRRVFRFDSLDISSDSNNTSLHLTVNGRPYKQHELGSGLSHFVICLANAAIKKPKWILIDEPEMNLHPALQLDFLTSLGSYAEEGVWFSTHSLGLARSAAEQVYSVSRVSEGNSKIAALANTPRLSEFLGEMSFSSHKELGFEKVLLVEGPTEVKVVQHFLRAISKDQKILLLPLHGHMPKADEFEEILRITPDVAALIDSERQRANAPLAKDRDDFVQLCANKKLSCHVLERRATENYFPDQVVKQVFGQNYRGLGPYEKLGDANPHWSKSQNWKLAEAMTFAEVRATDMGKFFETL